MLFLPPSLLRSLCVLVFIPSAILGVWAMPFAPRDALSTIPQLESRASGPKRKLPLMLLRYDQGGASLAGSTVQDRRNTDPDGPRIMILEDGEYWVFRLGRPSRNPMFFEAKQILVGGVFKIQSRQPSDKPHVGMSLGDVTIKGEDEEKLYKAIQNLPWHMDEFSALQEVVKYLSGKTPEHPLLEDVAYNPRQGVDQQSIFLAMADPNEAHLYPKSLYLKLKPGVTKEVWQNLNQPRSGNPLPATWPFRGTVMEGSTLSSHDIVESEDPKSKAGRSDGLPQ
ncbi:hypothetical protein EV359DRAFT_67570 [Lentinula novae-zelandiae]|nr:hypothetical protein EV359DRAFT_67570 [Lentinula novae-zelandiae]